MTGLRLRCRMERLEHHVWPTAWPGYRLDPPTPGELGATLNILSDCQHLDRVNGLRRVLETSLWAKPLEPELVDEMVAGFSAFVAAGGARDLAAWMTACG